MGIKLGWSNLADDATATTDSEIATLPLSNAQNEHIAKKWNTVAGVKSAYAIFDLGASQSCSLAALLGTNFTSSATIRIRASDADATVTGTLLYDSGTVAAGAVSGYGAIYKSWTAQAARYWRFDVADSTVASNLQVGRIFLGPSWAPAVGMMLGAYLQPVDPSIRTKSYGGQTWSDERPQMRVLSFTLDFQSAAEMYGNAFAMARSNGTVRDVLAIPDLTDTYLSQNAVWGLLETLEPIVNDKLSLYRQNFKIEERL